MASPEDLVAIKALLAGTQPGEWDECIELLRDRHLDWRHMARRARGVDADRTLSLLAFARSLDLGVPPEAFADVGGPLQTE